MQCRGYYRLEPKDALVVSPVDGAAERTGATIAVVGNDGLNLAIDVKQAETLRDRLIDLFPLKPSGSGRRQRRDKLSPEEKVIRAAQAEGPQRVLCALQETSGWRRTRAVAQRVGVSEMCARTRLHVLKAAGLVECRPIENHPSARNVPREWRAVDQVGN